MIHSGRSFCRAPLTLVVAVIACIGTGEPARAADLPVAPGQSIQAGIQAAQPGDRVLVQPGSYAEAIDFLGKSIEVIGVGGAGVTTIDATGLNTSVVTFQSAESATAILQGFSITGGSGQSVSGAGFGGGGVCARNGSTPTLRGCRVVNNTLAQAGHGGGVWAVWQAGTPARVTLEDCVIAANQGRGASGGLTLRRCTIQGNQDGGVYGAHAIEITDCLFAFNTTSGSGGGIANEYAVFPFKLERCVFIGNTAALAGGGASLNYFQFIGGPSLVTGCRFHANSAGTFGGGLQWSLISDSLFGSAARVRNCVFTGNQAAGGGAALKVSVSDTSSNTAVILEHCTLHQNVGSGVVGDANQLIVRDSIVWNQAAGFTSTGTISVTGSDVQGGFPGTGNFDLDPLFVDAANGDVRLRADSPCVDVVGTTAIDADVEGDLQVDSADVGGDEYHPHLALSGVPSIGNTVTLSVIGPPHAPIVFVFSSITLAGAPVPTPYGPFLLGPLIPLLLALPPLPASGYFGAALPLTAPLPVATVHLQAFVGFGPGNGTFSNAESVRLEN